MYITTTFNGWLFPTFADIFQSTLDCWFTYAKAMREFRNGLFAFHVQILYLIIWGNRGVTELITASLAFVCWNSFTLTVLYCLRGATYRTFAFVYLNDFLLFSNACKCSVYKASRYMLSCNLTYRSRFIKHFYVKSQNGGRFSGEDDNKCKKKCTFVARSVFWRAKYGWMDRDTKPDERVKPELLTLLSDWTNIQFNSMILWTMLL